MNKGDATKLRVSWLLLFVVGCGFAASGLMLTLLPDLHLAPAGMELPEIRDFHAGVADWMLHASLDETYSLMLIGLAVAIIASSGYRRRERSSWYTLVILTVGYSIGSILIHVFTFPPDVLLADMAFLSLFLSLAASLVGVILPVGVIFGPPPASTG